MQSESVLKFSNVDNFVAKPIVAPQADEDTCTAWGIHGVNQDFKPLTINRHKVAANDVRVDMLYCGICYTDVALALNEIGGTMYPIVPGHELVGVVEEIGSAVTRVKVGDKVGMGCLVDSCMDCKACKKNDDQYCEVAGWCHVYNDTKKYGHIGGNPDTQTLGGYSTKQTCHERFVITLPENIDLTTVGPLMCAGVTMYDPLRHWGATKGDKMTIGVVGVGGLGTMGLKIAKALGHRVVAISHSNKKEALAK